MAARCSTKKYGRFEFRAKLPTGQGVWPALWMLPQDDKYGAWAASGRDRRAGGPRAGADQGARHAALRRPLAGQRCTPVRTTSCRTSGTIADFHVYALEWEPGEIRWFVDGQQYASQSFWWSSSKTDGGKGRHPDG